MEAHSVYTYNTYREYISDYFDKAPPGTKNNSISNHHNFFLLAIACTTVERVDLLQ
jgi:hypothetical protein